MPLAPAGVLRVWRFHVRRLVCVWGRRVGLRSTTGAHRAIPRPSTPTCSPLRHASSPTSPPQGFGQPAQTSPFGSTSVFGQPQQPQQQQPASAGLFGASTGSAFGGSSAFGAAAGSTGFGSSAFGQPAASSFGATSAPAAGSSVFGQARPAFGSPSPSPFGASAPTSVRPAAPAPQMLQLTRCVLL